MDVRVIADLTEAISYFYFDLHRSDSSGFLVLHLQISHPNGF